MHKQRSACVTVVLLQRYKGRCLGPMDIYIFSLLFWFKYISLHLTSYRGMAEQQAVGAKLHALKHVGNFDGSTDVERWLDRVELALEIDQIPDSQHANILALHKEGVAHDT